MRQDRDIVAMEGVTRNGEEWTSVVPAFPEMLESVYFLHAGDFVKIGTTIGEIDARVARLQTGCPYPIRVLGFVYGGREREAKLHSQFSHLRHHGEWFHATPDLLACVAALLDSQETTDRMIGRAWIQRECQAMRDELELTSQITEQEREHTATLQELCDLYEALAGIDPTALRFNNEVVGDE